MYTLGKIKLQLERVEHLLLSKMTVFKIDKKKDRFSSCQKTRAVNVPRDLCSLFYFHTSAQLKKKHQEKHLNFNEFSVRLEQSKLAEIIFLKVPKIHESNVIFRVILLPFAIKNHPRGAPIKIKSHEGIYRP